MEKEEYNSKKMYGPYTERSPNIPEKRRTLGDYIIEGIGLIAIAGVLTAACGSCYQHATKPREEQYQIKPERK